MQSELFQLRHITQFMRDMPYFWLNQTQINHKTHQEILVMVNKQVTSLLETRTSRLYIYTESSGFSLIVSRNYDGFSQESTK
jgi:hypothetical protein